MKHIKFHFAAFPGERFTFVQGLKYLSLICTLQGLLTHLTCWLNLSGTAYLTFIILVFQAWVRILNICSFVWFLRMHQSIFVNALILVIGLNTFWLPKGLKSQGTIDFFISIIIQFAYQLTHVLQNHSPRSILGN